MAIVGNTQADPGFTAENGLIETSGEGASGEAEARSEQQGASVAMSYDNEYDLVVLGSGAAGLAAALDGVRPRGARAAGREVRADRRYDGDVGRTASGSRTTT